MIKFENKESFLPLHSYIKIDKISPSTTTECNKDVQAPKNEAKPTVSISSYINTYDKPLKVENSTNVNSYNKLQDELNKFIKQYRNNAPTFDNIKTRVEYYIKYNDTCINYYKQMMMCSDATDQDKAYCQRMINEHIRDKNYQLVDLNNWNKDNDGKTELFQDVFNEFVKNTPDITTTIDEKEVAISYIDRMLSCEDMPDDLRNYWTNKKVIIQSEIQTIKNEQAIELSKTSNLFEKLDDIIDEFNKYLDGFNQNPSFANVHDRVEYCVTYCITCISFLERMINSGDISDDMKLMYQQEIENFEKDIANHYKDLDRYYAEQNKQ